MSAVLKVVGERDADEPIGRAKVIARRPASGVFHAPHDVAMSADGQGNAANVGATAHGDSTGASRQNSEYRERAFVIGTYLIQEAIGHMREHLPAIFDQTRQIVDRRWSGRDPFPHYYFVILALRVPDVAERLVQEYATLLPSESIGRLASWFNARKRELVDRAGAAPAVEYAAEEVASC